MNPCGIFRCPPPDKHGFPVAHKINGYKSLLLAVHPRTGETLINEPVF